MAGGCPAELGARGPGPGIARVVVHEDVVELVNRFGSIRAEVEESDEPEDQSSERDPRSIPGGTDETRDITAGRSTPTAPQRGPRDDDSGHLPE